VGKDGWIGRGEEVVFARSLAEVMRLERRIRVGSIGWGAASSLWRDLVGGPLVTVAVCEDDAALAEGIRDRYRLEGAYTEVRAMLSEADLSAVLIGSPLGDYGEVVRKCLQAGLHVYAVPPGASTDEEAESFAAHAAYAESVGMVGFPLRHAPAHSDILRILAERPYGRALMARLRWTEPGSTEDFETWLARASLAPIDLLRAFLGDFTDITVQRLMQASGRYGVIVNAATRNETVITAEITSIGDAPHSRFEVEVGGVGWRAGASDTDHFWLSPPSQPVQVRRVTDLSTSADADSDRTGRRQSLALFAEAISDSRPVADDFTSAARTLEHVGRILREARVL
jgi:predicted dehydrogenase